MLDFLASQPHYREHLRPIADEIGGRFVTRLEASYGKGLLVVASQRDLFVGRRPAVFVEHGAGQTYSDSNPGYPGGEHRENVQLFICPSERVADLNRRRYPEARYAVVGCPKLDRWAGLKPHGTEIAIGFHWPCGIAPEAGTAFEHYSGALSGLVRHFGHILGHGHPRWGEGLTASYVAAGIKPVQTFEEVLERASVYITDNSSAGWEAMAVGIPVVWLNAPWYRRNVEHGLRFWEWADSGVQVDGPEELVAGVETALADPPAIHQRRAEAVAHVYGELDGKAAFRAGQAIEELMRSGRWNQTSMT
jgi:hypothetical protein